MSSDTIAIRVNHVSKCFPIYTKPLDRLKQLVFPRLPFWRGNTVFYQPFWALKDIDFELEKGETFGILGQNGSGKSTLLQLIVGTLTPTSGIVQVEGRVAALLELGSGFQPQFTGLENIYLNGRLLGLSQEDIENRLDAILGFADIGAAVHQPVRTYSSGMMMRLAFAVQAAVEADVLIIDEALAVGDARFQVKCFRRLEQLKEAGTTILFVSHDVETVRSLCRKGLVLEKGRAVFIGEAREATTHYYKILFPDQESPEEAVSNPSTLKKISAAVPQMTDKNVLRITPEDHEKGAWGNGGAWLDWIEFHGVQGTNILMGGQQVIVRCKFSWDQEKVQESVALFEKNISLGIAFSDKKGRYLFGCNTFDQNVEINPALLKSSIIKFSFLLPHLTPDEYFVTVGIPIGSLHHHVQLKWYDCLVALRIVDDKRKAFSLFAIDYKTFVEQEESHKDG